MWSPKDTVDQPLHVVTCISNTNRYKSRWKLYRDFQRICREGGAVLHTVEAAFGERNFALDEHADHENASDPEHEWKSSGPPNVPRKGQGTYTQVRLNHLQEIWLKENLLNIGVSRLPTDWKYVAFIDADVMFARPDWVSETLHQLQHFHVVQMFSEAIDLDPKYEPRGLGQYNNARQMSHAYCHVNGLLVDQVTNDAYDHKHRGAAVAGAVYRHPGFAWAWRREAFDAVGGLMDHVLLGSADWHMAWALVGRVEETLKAPMSKAYNELCHQWQDLAERYIRRNLGYVSGTLMHHWHGKKVDRGYATRWKIMADHQYDPSQDLVRDWQGLIRLKDIKHGLRDDCRQYFRRRHEDSIDL